MAVQFRLSPCEVHLRQHGEQVRVGNGWHDAQHDAPGGNCSDESD